MDTDSSQPSCTVASHQCVLSTLGAVCTEESVIHEVIPRLIEHAQHLCCGKCLLKIICIQTKVT